MSMPNKKRRRGRILRPEHTVTPTPGERITKVRDPRASARFCFGDLVLWCDDEATYIGEDPEDANFAIVRLFDGSLVRWPAALPGMRRVVKSDPDLLNTLINMYRSAEEAVEVDYYDSIEVARTDETPTLPDLGDTLVKLDTRSNKP